MFSVVSVYLFTSPIVGERAIGIRLKHLLVTARKRSLGQGNVQGLSVPFACVGSGDPVRVLRLYTTNTLDIL